MDWQTLIVPGCIALLLVISLLIALILFWKAVRLTLRLGSHALGAFGETPATRLMSLAIASIIFPRTLSAVVTSLLAFLSKLGTELPISLTKITLSLRPTAPGRPIEAGEILNAFTTTLVLIVQAFTDVFASAISMLSAIPIGDVIIFLAVAVLAGTLFRIVNRQSGPHPRLWITEKLVTMSPQQKTNLIFAIILFVAVYLSIASLAAIPALQETSSPDQISKEKLSAVLTKAKQGTETAFKNYKPPESPLQEFEAILASSTTAPENLKIAAKKVVARLAELRGDLVRRQQLYLDDLPKDCEDALLAAITTFEIESLGRKGSRESASYFGDIVEWYGAKLSIISAKLNNTRYAIESGDQEALLIIGRLKEILGASVENQSPLFSGLLSDAKRPPYIMSGNFWNGDPLPARPALGSYLGPFSFVASWLLRAESLPLALIVGMIGFGLLGAACTTFIRDRQAGAPQGALVTDLARVIIPGLSAAVVVFLAVEGGLAIFSTSASQPNPYVLFLTCLIAAVFSESIWEWAQGWLKKTFPGVASGGGQSGQNDSEDETKEDNVPPAGASGSQHAT
jgi:ABC-type multidrug transport system fused ATPase/permease subunit